MVALLKGIASLLLITMMYSRRELCGAGDFSSVGTCQVGKTKGECREPSGESRLQIESSANDALRIVSNSVCRNVGSDCGH